MTKAVLALNAGSSSLKFAVFSIEPNGALKIRLKGEIEGLDHNSSAQEDALSNVIRFIEKKTENLRACLESI